MRDRLGIFVRPASCALGLIVMAMPCIARSDEGIALKPGEYISEQGAGNLALKAGKPGVLNFAIESVGGNGHGCTLDGELRNGKATLDGIDSTAQCVVTMTATRDGIDVKASANGACLYYCGVRAGFEGMYFRPAPACVRKSVDATRTAFRKLYAAKRFAEARAKLEPVLVDCIRTLDWLETGRIRNDLAVALHKLRDFKACQAVLQPLAEDASATDMKLREDYPPTDFESYLPIVRATRTNLRLCKVK